MILYSIQNKKRSRRRTVFVSGGQVTPIVWTWIETMLMRRSRPPTVFLIFNRVYNGATSTVISIFESSKLFADDYNTVLYHHNLCISTPDLRCRAPCIIRISTRLSWVMHKIKIENSFYLYIPWHHIKHKN